MRNDLPLTSIAHTRKKSTIIYPDHTKRNKEIKRLYLETRITYQKLADKFNISLSSAYKAVNG